MLADSDLSSDMGCRSSGLMTRYGCFLQEWLLSIPLFVGWFFSLHGTVSGLVFPAGWFVMGSATGITCHLGRLARRECGDLRFVCLSLYKKYPVWLNWVLALVCIGVLLKPFFALSVYLAAGLAFYRGYAFRGMEKKGLGALFLDMSIRLAGGIVLGRI